ncbi:MAG: hypothetical protein IKF51_09185 [Solobacterium sp.]|nr:hypothetical protein [Solobacterium sp.]
MRFYLIDSVLRDSSKEECLSSDLPRIIVVTREEWDAYHDELMPGVEHNRIPAVIHSSKAEEHFYCLTGTFSVPNRNKPSSIKESFAFVIDPSGMLIADDSGAVNGYLAKIKENMHWNHPCLERFIYDFMDQMIGGDVEMLERYERRLDEIEKDILEERDSERLKRMSSVRSDLRELRIHYEQLIDMCQEFEENTNGFFQEENLRYFHMSTSRVERLYNSSGSLRDYTMQLNDLYRAQSDRKQNRIMTALTVITAIFMPLTLIVGWYGMNFIYMPELTSPYGYPAVIVGSLLIVIVGLVYFHKKNWL